MKILQVTRYIECILQIGVKNMIRTQSDACIEIDACHKINICAKLLNLETMFAERSHLQNYSLNLNLLNEGCCTVHPLTHGQFYRPITHGEGGRLYAYKGLKI